jgi:AAA family ATP:ADP antiporter
MKGETVSGDASGEGKARKLLVKALEEKLDHDLEMIFRFLGLRYKPKEMYDAYLGIKSQRSRLQANAIEFLDNILRSEFKKLIVPIIEMAPVETLLNMTKSEFGYAVPTDDESVEILLEGPDNWLRACALYLIAELHYDKYKEKVVGLGSHPDNVVRETARLCFDRLDKSH